MACSGGLELLFDKQKELDAEVPVPAGGKVNICGCRIAFKTAWRACPSLRHHEN